MDIAIPWISVTWKLVEFVVGILSSVGAYAATPLIGSSCLVNMTTQIVKKMFILVNSQ